MTTLALSDDDLDLIRSLTPAEWAGLSPRRRAAVKGYLARVAAAERRDDLEPHQRPPADNDWKHWLVRGGRGSGKTEGASRYVNDCAMANVIRVGIVGPTLGDAVEACVEGDSGLKSVNPSVRLVGGNRRLHVRWPNGSVGLLFGTKNAEDVERLRAGGNRHLDWWEEYATWVQLEKARDQALLGLRLGDWPRVVITTTPKPRKALRDLIADPRTVEARTADGRIPTMDDNPHLNAEVRAELLRQYEGTRIGRQELQGELLDAVEGALWTWDLIAASREDAPDDLQRVVVGVDPAFSSSEAADESGIVVVGRSWGVREGLTQAWVLEDLSCHGGPDVWAKRAVAAYHHHEANAIICESNLGGAEFAIKTLHQVDPTVKVRTVKASRGSTKGLRAEPVAMLYDKGRVHHAKVFNELEEQMCVVGDTPVLTDSGWRAIADMWTGDCAWTRLGWKPVQWVGSTGFAETLLLTTLDGRQIEGTACHPVWVIGAGWVPLSGVHAGDMLLAWPVPPFVHSSRSAESGSSSRNRAITAAAAAPEGRSFIESFTRSTTGRSRRDTTSTISTTTGRTTALPISPPSARPSTSMHTAILERPSQAPRSGRPGRRSHGRNASRERLSAPFAGLPFSRPGCGPAIAVGVARVEATHRRTMVFDATVAEAHEFLARGLLVHNTNWAPPRPGATSTQDSPDRLDALVWALTDLLIDGAARPMRSNMAAISAARL